MDDQSVKAINQEIFQMGLSVETVSVYLLCCGLAEAGSAISRKTLTGIWNGTPLQLSDGLKILEERGILDRMISGSGDNAVYRLSDPKNWNV